MNMAVGSSQLVAPQPVAGGAQAAGGQAAAGAVWRPGGGGLAADVAEVASGFWSLVVGLGVTLAEFFRPTITLHYPHESLKMTARFRGHVELAPDPATGRPLCVACGSCQRACPSDCILVEGVKREGERRKSPTVFRLDFTKCSLCGACVEVCPTKGLRYSKEYNLASTDKSVYVFDLLKRLQAEKK